MALPKITLKKQLATTLLKLRTKARLSQKELADVVKCHHNTICSLEDEIEEQGCSFYLLERLADFFNISIDELLHGKNLQTEQLSCMRKFKSLNEKSRQLILDMMDAANDTRW